MVWSPLHAHREFNSTACRFYSLYYLENQLFFITIPFWRIIKSFFLLNFQLATNTLERVAPLTHAVGNVLKRVFVIGFSILIFGNDLSTT
jgi:hypothetical protein